MYIPLYGKYVVPVIWKNWYVIDIFGYNCTLPFWLIFKWNWIAFLVDDDICFGSWCCINLFDFVVVVDKKDDKATLSY